MISESYRCKAPVAPLSFSFGKIGMSLVIVPFMAGESAKHLLHWEVWAVWRAVQWPVALLHSTCGNCVWCSISSGLYSRPVIAGRHSACAVFGLFFYRPVKRSLLWSILNNRRSLVLIRLLCTGNLVAFYLQRLGQLHFTLQWGPVSLCSLVSNAEPRGVCHCVSVSNMWSKHFAANLSCSFYKWDDAKIIWEVVMSITTYCPFM